MAITNAADIATGATISFASIMSQIVDFSFDGWLERAEVDISHSTSTNGWRVFLPGDLRDGGSMDCEINFLTNALAAYKTAATAAKSTCLVTWPIPAAGGASAGTLSIDGFMSNMSVACPTKDEDVMSATVHVKFSGEPTFVDAA